MRKIILVIPIVAVVLIALTFFGSDQNNEKLKETFYLDATFFPSQNKVYIQYIDSSNMTESVTLEVLGMKESYQKKFSTSEFLDIVSFDSEPEYGWEAHPVTLIVNHKELGKVGIKTEIHEPDTPYPEIIFGNQ